jgi:hypothetical protein
MGTGAKRGNGSQDGKNVSGARKVFVVPSSRIVSEKGYAVKDSHTCLIKHDQTPGSGQMARGAEGGEDQPLALGLHAGATRSDAEAPVPGAPTTQNLRQ